MVSLFFSFSLSLSLSLLMSLSLLFGLVFAYYLFASFVIVLSVSVYLYLPHLPLFLSLALNHTRHQEGQTDGCGLTQGRSPSPHSTGCKGDLHLKLTLKRKKIKFCYGHEEWLKVSIKSTPWQFQYIMVVLVDMLLVVDGQTMWHAKCLFVAPGRISSWPLGDIGVEEGRGGAWLPWHDMEERSCRGTVSPEINLAQLFCYLGNSMSNHWPSWIFLYK